jgi:hypothetical protein
VITLEVNAIKSSQIAQTKITEENVIKKNSDANLLNKCNEELNKHTVDERNLLRNQLSQLDKNIQTNFDIIQKRWTEHTVHKPTGDNVFTIKEKPDKTLYQYPPEKLLDGISEMWKRMGVYNKNGKLENKAMAGIIIDELK